VVVTLSFGSRVLFVLNVLNNILFFFMSSSFTSSSFTSSSFVTHNTKKKWQNTNDETPKFRLCFWKNDDEKEDGKKH